MKKVLLSLLAFSFAFVGCQTEINILPNGFDNDAPDFFAEVADVTRTQLSDSNAVLWNESDLISIFKRNDHNMKYKTKSLSESRTSCSFTFTGEGVRRTGSEIERYYSIYPYADDNAVNDNVLSFAIPTIQTYKADDELSYVPMVAAGTNLNLKFKAPSSVFRMYLSKFDPNELNSSIYVLKSVTITSETIALAGVAEVDMTKDVYEAVINTDAGVSSNSVMLDLVDGAELSSTKQSFFIALPKFSAPANDLTVTFEVEVDGKTFYVEKKISSAISFDAGRIKAVELALNVDEFTGSTEDGIGGDITEDENFTQNPDGSYSCDITEDMIIDEPLYLPEGTTATISLGEGKTLSNSSINTNKSLVVIEDGAELTIDGSGAITSVVPATQALSATRAASNTAFPIVVNGTLRIKGGRFTLNSYATSWLNCGIYVGPKGKLIIEGGRFHSPKGSFIFGHEHGNRPEIIIHGGRFEGFDPSDNDFDGNGSNYLEPEYASYYVAENELVVAERTANWEVDNSYLLNSILKNGGNATLIDSVHDSWAFNVDNNINVNYPVNISVSGDPSKLQAECILYIETPINCYADVNIKGDSYDPNMLYIDSIEAIANVYNGATLTLGEALYFGGGDEVTETLFNLYGGNIVINDGSYTLSERINAANMFVIDSRYAEESSLVINGGVFYGFDPSAVTVGEEVKSYVAEGLSAYEVSQLAYGIYPTGSAFDVDKDNFYLLRSIFKNGGRANISGEIVFEESLVALNPVVLNMGGSVDNYLKYSGSDAMIKCYSDVSIIADEYSAAGIESSSVVAEVYEDVKLDVDLRDCSANVANSNNAMFVANGGQIDIHSGLFQFSSGVAGLVESEEYLNSEISAYGGTYYDFNPEAFVGEGYTTTGSNGHYQVVPATF